MRHEISNIENRTSDVGHGAWDVEHQTSDISDSGTKNLTKNQTKNLT